MSDLLLRLAKLDTCAVSDALDRVGATGVLLGLAALSAPRRIAGRAITVDLVEADGSPSHRHLGTAAVDACGPGQIIVVANHGRLDVSGWGGILAQGAKARGVEGVVVDGACRDIDEYRDLDLPVYARAGVPITARGRIRERDFNIPVTLGASLTVAPDDFVLADGSGVVFVPAAIADEVITIGEEIVEREAAMAAAARAGERMTEVMGASYESLAGKRTDR